MSQTVFTRFRFEDQGYPRMRGTMIPRSRAADIFGMLRPARKSPPFAHVALFVRARYALFHAFRICGAKEGKNVLLPAYHCITMVEPVLRCGANPFFYRVNRDMSPDVDHINAILAEESDQTSCLVLTHYFGFRQDTGPLLNCLERHGVELIEDCAHIIEPLPGIGDRGRAAAFCPAKFFPIPDGGALVGLNVSGDTATALRKRSKVSEARLLGRLLNLALDPRARAEPIPHGSLERSGTDPQRGARTHRHETRRLDTTTITRRGDTCSYNIDCEDMLASLWSRKILDRQDRDFVSRRRRDNFVWWLSRVQRISGADPVFSDLEPDTVPYVFPLLIESSEWVFDSLKRSGMPIYRWDELAQSDCTNSEFFRTHLIQLPCHQNLESHDREWMAETLEWALRMRERHEVTG